VQKTEKLRGRIIPETAIAHGCIDLILSSGDIAQEFSEIVEPRNAPLALH
jgi:hypothetical protein